MQKDITFDRMDAFRVILAIMTFGIGWVANNQATAISFSAVIIVWILALVMKRYNITPTRVSLTVIVFAVAIGLSLLFQPVILPAFPSWTGDASAFTPLLIAYGVSFLKLASGVVAYATGVYNILLAEVLYKVQGAASFVFKGILSIL